MKGMILTREVDSQLHTTTGNSLSKSLQLTLSHRGNSDIEETELIRIMNKMTQNEIENCHKM